MLVESGFVATLSGTSEVNIVVMGNVIVINVINIVLIKVINYFS